MKIAQSLLLKFENKTESTHCLFWCVPILIFFHEFVYSLHRLGVHVCTSFESIKKNNSQLVAKFTCKIVCLFGEPHVNTKFIMLLRIQKQSKTKHETSSWLKSKNFFCVTNADWLSTDKKKEQKTLSAHLFHAFDICWFILIKKKRDSTLKVSSIYTVIYSLHARSCNYQESAWEKPRCVPVHYGLMNWIKIESMWTWRSFLLLILFTVCFVCTPLLAISS